MSQQQRVKKQTSKRWWLWGIAGLLVIAMISGCGGNSNDEEIEIEEDISVDESKVYDGAYKFTGKAVKGLESTKVIIDLSVTTDDDGGSYTDIVMTEGMTDITGNVFIPGIYEFQFVEYPENKGMGSSYVYLNIDSADPIRISGNPKASDAGKEYELKEGDTISVDFWTIATFYKVDE